MNKYIDLLKKDKLGILGLVILLFLAILALAAPILPALDPMYQPLKGYDPQVFSATPPDFPRHLLGTDAWGRDLLSQLLFGIRTAFMVGLSAAVSGVALGTVLGLMSAWYGGIVDTLVMRSVDIIFCLPFIPILIVINAVLGGLNIWGVVLLIAALSWAGVARMVRSQALSLKERDYIEAARAYAAGNSRILFKHLLPGVLPLTVVYLCFRVSGTVFLVASLSFLGFGDPTQVSLGMILQWCMKTGHTFNAPWWMLPPGIAISMFGLGTYLFGRSISDIEANPKLRARG
jgi:peptide/nickel transport system permease protein